MERVLVTGGAAPIGRRLLQRLREEPGVEKVIGVEPRASAEWMDGVELIAYEPDHGELTRFLIDQSIDTVIDAGLVPSRSGSFATSGPADVIAAMRLCAAIGSPRAKVRSHLVISSSAVYPVDSYAPLLHREDDITEKSEVEPAASLLEAEDYARDVAERMGHLDVAILRLAELGGAGLGGPLGSALLQPVVPSPIGYDPHVQWLHADDALEAIVFCARLELAGIYNVASNGVLRWSQAREMRGSLSLPVVPMEAGLLAPLLRQVGVPHLPGETGSVLRFGSAVDTAKLRSAGWQPRYDQRDCVQSLQR